MVSPTFANIDLEALKANYLSVSEFIQRRSSKKLNKVPVNIIAVIKANAYGHGSIAVARALEEAGSFMLACADIEEGVKLRESGVRTPILVFGALSVSDLNGVFTHNLIPTVSSPFAARALQAAAETRNFQLHCHLKIDTGMNRFGFRHDNLHQTIPEVLLSRNLIFDAVYTHFATADQLSNQIFERQQKHFIASIEVLSMLGFQSRFCHAANSASLLRDDQCWFDAVRPGLLLYGVVPPPLIPPPSLRLRPVMSLRSRIVAVKGVRPGEILGYGGQFAAVRPTRVAIVPAGYADGLDVRLAGVGFALVRGCRVPIIGSVCMDSITIDVTELDVSPGDEVVILGTQDDEHIDIVEMAKWIGTVPYEILCRTGIRIERVYKSDNLLSKVKL